MQEFLWMIFLQIFEMTDQKNSIKMKLCPLGGLEGVLTMKALRFIVFLLTVIGALNWGIIGLFGYDLLGAILGGETTEMRRTGLERIVFAIIGLAGLYSIGLLCRCCGNTRCNCMPKSNCCNKK